MGMALSMLLIVAGAVLRYGLTRDTWGDWNLDAIGSIAMIAGAAGLLLSLLFRIPRRRRAVKPEVIEEPRHVHASH